MTRIGGVFSTAVAVIGLAAAVIGVTPVEAQSDCNHAAPKAVTLVQLPGNPFQAISTADGCWIFVSMLQPQRNSRKGLAVIHRSDGKLDLVRVIDDVGNPAGMTITHDGKLLIIAAGDRVKFLDVARAISGDGNPVLGELDEKKEVGLIQATVTSNDSLLFVSLEHGGSVEVIDLFTTRKNSFSDPVIIGRLPAVTPVSVVLSPDEKLLYVSAMSSPPAFNWPHECANARSGQTVPKGAVLVFDVARAAAGREDALAGKAQAGCSPVRLALSPGGDTVYATVRWDNALLALDTHRILSDPDHALLARVPVGMEPVGVLPLSNSAIIVANSHRFAADAREDQTLSIIASTRLDAGASAVVGSIPAGAFPRELKLTADGRTLLLTNFGSRTLEVVDLGAVFGPQPSN